MWSRGAMVLSIFALVGLIFATPDLLGRPSPGLDSLPLLIIGMSRNESSFIVNVGAAVQAYRYDLIRLSFNESAPSVNGTYAENDTYGFHRWVSANASFTVDVYLVDHGLPFRNYFQYNVTVRAEKDLDNRTVMVFTFPYESDNVCTEMRLIPPADFRCAIPRRGTLP